MFFICLLIVQAFSLDAGQEAENFFRRDGNHTNNWAIIASTSRFWFNYRHTANSLGLYRTVKRLGIPDSNIILMLADDHSCDPRNPFPGEMFHNKKRESNIYGDEIEIDYRGYDVTVENFIRVLTGRHDPSTPRSQRLLSDSRSNILLYMSGHGGNEFLKFQDSEELSAKDLADSIEQMHQKERYNEIFFMIDTCQAGTMTNALYSPNVLAVGSSLYKENAYSHHLDATLGVSVIDRFSFYTLEYLDKIQVDSELTIHHLSRIYTFDKLNANVQWRTDLYRRKLNKVLLTDFFGSVTSIQLTPESYPLVANLVRLERKNIQKLSKAVTGVAQRAQEGQEGSSQSFLLTIFLFGLVVALVGSKIEV